MIGIVSSKMDKRPVSLAQPKMFLSQSQAGVMRHARDPIVAIPRVHVIRLGKKLDTKDRWDSITQTET